MELEDLKDLVDFTITTKEGLFLDELSKDASHCPDIHAETVLPLAQQDLWRAVPEGLNLMREGLNWNSKSAGEAKISNFEHPVLVDQKVLRLEVAVDDAAGVAEIDAVDQLEHNEADLVLRDRVFVLREVFFEVVLRVLEHQVQLLLAGQVDDVHETAWERPYLTILGCGFNSLRIEISRMAVEGTPSSSF